MTLEITPSNILISDTKVLAFNFASRLKRMLKVKAISRKIYEKSAKVKESQIRFLSIETKKLLPFSALKLNLPSFHSSI